MAKAKKDSAPKHPEKKPAHEAAAKQTPAKQLAAKKPAAKANPKPMMGGSSLIDTSHVAENAAKMLVAGVNMKKATKNSGNPESSLFKQMKSGLSKPSSAAMSNLLDKTHGPTAAEGHGGFSKQVGHNQTQGTNATRTNVPRRTAG